MSKSTASSTGQKSVKGLPKRVRNAALSAKHARYLSLSTCYPCSAVFRSPKYRAAHIAGGHLTFVGVNRKRASSR